MAVLVSVVNLAVGDDSDGFERYQIDPSTQTFAAPPTTPTEEGAPRGSIHLEADGLGLVHFGQPSDDVIRELSERLGVPDEDDRQPCQHDAGTWSHWVRWADLSVRLSRAEFVGYIEGVHYPPGNQALDFTTSKGLSPGDSMDLVHQIYGDVPIRHETPRPGQFAATLFTVIDDEPGHKLSGVLEQDGTRKYVTAIFAGHLC